MCIIVFVNLRVINYISYILWGINIVKFDDEFCQFVAQDEASYSFEMFKKALLEANKEMCISSDILEQFQEFIYKVKDQEQNNELQEILGKISLIISIN